MWVSPKEHISHNIHTYKKITRVSKWTTLVEDRVEYENQNINTINTHIMLTSKLMVSNTYVIFDHQLFAMLSRSFNAYISAINLQHWLMTSGGQSRSTLYFSFWTSSKFGKDGERETILSIKRLHCLSYTGHFKTKCKTHYGSLEHSGQVWAIVLLIRHVNTARSCRFSIE